MVGKGGEAVGDLGPRRRPSRRLHPTTSPFGAASLLQRHPPRLLFLHAASLQGRVPLSGQGRALASQSSNTLHHNYRWMNMCARIYAAGPVKALALGALSSHVGRESAKV